jgi:hypothetical protein
VAGGGGGGDAVDHFVHTEEPPRGGRVFSRSPWGASSGRSRAWSEIEHDERDVGVDLVAVEEGDHVGEVP